MKRENWIQKTFEGVLQLIYPPLCLACQAVIEERINGIDLCKTCLNSFVSISPDFVEENILRRLDPCFLDGLMVCFGFNETLQALIHQVKYGRFQHLAENLADLAGSKLNCPVRYDEIDLVIPVPLHRVREKERGFNQSLAIAAGFFRNSTVPVISDLLVRQRETGTQTELMRDERITNVREAFILANSAEFDNKRVLLVDDVVTTGATLNECARTIKKSGVVSVHALALATPLSESVNFQNSMSS